VNPTTETEPLNLHCNFCNKDMPYNAMHKKTVCKPCFANQQREYRLRKKLTKVEFWLEDELHAELKVAAQEMNMSMRQLINAAVADYLEDMRN